jgi:hypothetical protein
MRPAELHEEERMNLRRMATALVFVTAITLAAVATASAGEGPARVTTATDAFAQWVETDGCIRTFVGVDGFEQVDRQQGEEVLQFQSFNAGVFVENVCTGEVVGVGDNLNGTAIVDVSAGRATFEADAPWIGLSIRIRWRATGPPTILTTHEDGISQRVLIRPAEASGSVTVNGVEYAVGPSTIGQLVTRHTVEHA